MNMNQYPVLDVGGKPQWNLVVNKIHMKGSGLWLELNKGPHRWKAGKETNEPTSSPKIFHVQANFMANHLWYDEEIFTFSCIAGQCCQLSPLNCRHSSILSACKGLGGYDGVLRDCRDDDLTRGGKEGAVQMNSNILVTLKMLTLWEQI